MSNLKDLFVSYKIVGEPEITVPKFDPTITPLSMILLQGDFSDKVEAAKTRTAEAKKFLYISGGAKEKPYEVSNYAELPKEQLQQDSSKKLGLSGDRAAWKSELYSAYKKAGCSDSFARNLVGQDALETGWGQHIVGDFNYGNIKTGKSWGGRSRKAHDKREGSYDAYRSYDSVDHYVKDKLELLTGRYGITGDETPEQFTDKLVAGGYATSKTYRENVLRTIKSV